MEHLTVKAASTATDQGRFSAIAATWGIDREGDQIRKGAFAATIKHWQQSGRSLPLHWNHSGDAADIIGWVDPGSMREADEGLYVKGQLDLEESTVAREAWRSMKNNSVALSFGFMILDGVKREDGIRELRKLDLFEISIVAAPANPDTRIIDMKSAPESVPSIKERVLAEAWEVSRAMKKFDEDYRREREAEAKAKKVKEHMERKAAWRALPIRMKRFTIE